VAERAPVAAFIFLRIFGSGLFKYLDLLLTCLQLVFHQLVCSFQSLHAIVVLRCTAQLTGVARYRGTCALLISKVLFEIETSVDGFVARGTFYLESGTGHCFMFFFVLVLVCFRALAAPKLGRIKHILRESAHHARLVHLFAVGAFFVLL